MNLKKSDVRMRALETAKQQYKAWRKVKKPKQPIPKNLWQVAVSLCEDFTIGKVARELSLSHPRLKAKVIEIGNDSNPSVAPPPFFEVDFLKPPQMSECVVSLENQSGDKMSMVFKGEIGLDLLELGKAFWRREL